MITYPLSFRANAVSTQGIQQPWKSGVPSFGQLELSIPHEFGGPNSAYSPEDVFAIALVSCFIATFKVVSEKSRLMFDTLTGDCEFTIDRAVDHSVKVTSANFTFVLSGACSTEKAERLLNQVSKQCMLINSLSLIPTFRFSIS